MKKSLRLTMGIVALVTFGLNLSIDSNGEFSILSTARAVGFNEPEEGKWSPEEKKCYNANGELITGKRITCFGGDQTACTPKKCPTSSPE